MGRCRILLADGRSLLLDVLARFLAGIPEVDVVGRARHGLEAMAMASYHRPDLVVVSLVMSGLTGLEVTRRVVRSFHDEPRYRHAAELAGTDGFVLKRDLGTKLVPLFLSRWRGEVFEGRSPNRTGIWLKLARRYGCTRLRPSRSWPTPTISIGGRWCVC